jgi:hypothetical protein
LGVAVEVEKPVNVTEVADIAPDVVVVATGAVRHAALVPGWGPTLSVDGALAQPSWRGRTVVIVDTEGGWVTASVAETIASDGGAVHLVSMLAAPLSAITYYSRMTAVERLRSHGVEIWTSSSASFDNGSALISSTLHSGHITIDHVTDVVVSAPATARDDLSRELSSAGLEVVTIGDANAPRSLLESMFEGHQLGRTL